MKCTQASIYTFSILQMKCIWKICWHFLFVVHNIKSFLFFPLKFSLVYVHLPQLQSKIVKWAYCNCVHTSFSPVHILIQLLTKKPSFTKSLELKPWSESLQVGHALSKQNLIQIRVAEVFLKTIFQSRGAILLNSKFGQFELFTRSCLSIKHDLPVEGLCY